MAFVIFAKEKSHSNQSKNESMCVDEILFSLFVNIVKCLSLIANLQK
jgi:hypothetical protein